MSGYLCILKPEYSTTLPIILQQSTLSDRPDLLTFLKESTIPPSPNQDFDQEFPVSTLNKHSTKKSNCKLKQGKKNSNPRCQKYKRAIPHSKHIIQNMNRDGINCDVYLRCVQKQNGRNNILGPVKSGSCKDYLNETFEALFKSDVSSLSSDSENDVPASKKSKKKATIKQKRIASNSKNKLTSKTNVKKIKIESEEKLNSITAPNFADSQLENLLGDLMAKENIDDLFNDMYSSLFQDQVNNNAEPISDTENKISSVSTKTSESSSDSSTNENTTKQVEIHQLGAEIPFIPTLSVPGQTFQFPHITYPYFRSNTTFHTQIQCTYIPVTNIPISISNDK